jgi:hypothetical protein
MLNRLAEFTRGVYWLSVVVALLSTAAILWVIISPDHWTSCLVLVGAAVALALLGKDRS